jgi:hypothetical protein
MHVSDGAVSSVKADENRIPHYSTIHNYQFPPSPDFHQPPFPQNNNSHVYYSNNINEPNWMLTQTESASGFPPLEYGTPSLSPSPYPVQEYSKPSSLFGQVIGCNNETLAMYKQMRRFCVSTKHLLEVPHIAPGTCMLFLYNIMTQQTYGVYQSTSCGMQQVCYTSALMLVPSRVISVPESGLFIITSGVDNLWFSPCGIGMVVLRYKVNEEQLLTACQRIVLMFLICGIDTWKHFLRRLYILSGYFKLLSLLIEGYAS